MMEFRISRLLKNNSFLEIYFWLFISVLVGGRPLYWGVILGYYRSEKFILEFYTEILFTILVFLFPFLFKLIFGELPLEYIRNGRKRRLYNQIIKPQNSNVDNEEILQKKETNEINFNNISNNVIRPNINIDKEEVLFESFLDKSRQLSDKLFLRAGAYLLIGCLIAFAGVLFFYFQTTTLHNVLAPIVKELTTSRILFEYLPRIGTLAFVEAIAFFFSNSTEQQWKSIGIMRL